MSQAHIYSPKSDNYQFIDCTADDEENDILTMIEDIHTILTMRGAA